MNLLPSAPGPALGPTRYELPFLERRSETPTVSTFRFSTTGTDFRFRSNQAIRLILPGLSDPRPGRMFSLSSSPTEEGHLDVTVKMTGSAYKTALGSLTPGDRVQVLGPLGDLLYNPSRPAVFIAGGIGVTPFRGMLRYAIDARATSPIVLLYSARTPEEFAFRDEFDAMARQHPAAQVRYTVTRPAASETTWNGRTGRIDETLIEEALDGLDRPKVYVVGLPQMAQDVLGLLRTRWGFVEDDLEYEYFMGY